MQLLLQQVVPLAQTFPQAPQLLLLLLVLTQAPLQQVVPLAQTFPQAPQLLLLLLVLTQMPLQQTCPAGQQRVPQITVGGWQAHLL
jgi:hypothetical protein